MSTPRRPSRGVRPGLASPPGPPSPDAVSGRIVAFSAAALGLLLLSTILGRQHLVVPGDPDRFAGLLSWADLERLRSYHELRTPRLRVVGEGEYLSEESYLTTHTVRRARPHHRRHRPAVGVAVDRVHPRAAPGRRAAPAAGRSRRPVRARPRPRVRTGRLRVHATAGGVRAALGRARRVRPPAGQGQAVADPPAHRTLADAARPAAGRRPRDRTSTRPFTMVTCGCRTGNPMSCGLVIFVD